MEHGSRTRLMSAIVLVAVFGAGVLLGLAADSNLGAEPAQETSTVAAEGGEAEPTRERRPWYMQVEPNEAQLSLIDSIVAEHRARTNELDEERRARFRIILLDTREAIKGVLRPEQAAEYQRIIDERDARNAADRENEDERD